MSEGLFVNLRVRLLCESLRAAGVRFGVERGRLRVRGPGTVLTDSVYQQILYYKESLLELVQSEAASSRLPHSVADPEDIPFESEPASPAVLYPAADPDDIARWPDHVPIEAVFHDGVKAQVVSDGPGRYSIRLWSGLGWTRQEGSASPSRDHARRTAEHWYGPPLEGWRPLTEAEK